MPQLVGDDLCQHVEVIARLHGEQYLSVALHGGLLALEGAAKPLEFAGGVNRSCGTAGAGLSVSSW